MSLVDVCKTFLIIHLVEWWIRSDESFGRFQGLYNLMIFSEWHFSICCTSLSLGLLFTVLDFKVVFLFLFLFFQECNFTISYLLILEKVTPCFVHFWMYVCVGAVATIWRQRAGPGCWPRVAADLWREGFHSGTDRHPYHQTEPALQHHVSTTDQVQNLHWFGLKLAQNFMTLCKSYSMFFCCKKKRITTVYSQCLNSKTAFVVCKYYERYLHEIKCEHVHLH